MTTIGVLPICNTKSNAFARVSADVRLPLMISTSCMRSTGEKKCRPMNCSGRFDASASPVIGRVEVFDATTAPGSSTASASRVTCAFNSRFSNTASITRSQSERSATAALGVIAASTFSASAAELRPFSTRLARSCAEYALPFSAFARSTSFSTHGTLRLAHAHAMPAPIIPAPRMPTRPARQRGGPAGRLLPAFTSFSWKNSVPIMFFATWPVTSRVM